MLLITLVIISINLIYSHFCFKGDVAQLARALDWQSRGRRFESALLHRNSKALEDLIF